jgi:hypothetical protein
MPYQIHSVVLRGLLMADEVPSGDKAVFAFLELFALAFAFEGAGALLRGDPLWRIIGAWVLTAILFVAGIQWPALKKRIGTSRIGTPRNDPRIWLSAGAVSGLVLGVFGMSLLNQIRLASPASTPAPVHPSPEPLPTLESLLLGWGSDDPGWCIVKVDGTQLLKWKEKYNVGFICAFEDATLDKFEDDRISVSPSFSIHQGEIRMVIPWSPKMSDVADRRFEEAKKALPKEASKNPPHLRVQVWNEIILIAKSSKVSDIHRLSDVARYGGAVVSQGLPSP